MNSVDVQVRGVEKYFGSVKGLSHVDVDVAAGQTACLLGPSGCGKTTTLRCIAGLEVPSAGTIRIGEKTVYDARSRILIPPEKRNIGMVFQSYAIWPHLSVSGNVGYPLKLRRLAKPEIQRRVDEVLDLVGLGALALRSASALSGGQQQRVALARALVHRPSLVLFDEPLSNLDANLRLRMRHELKALQRRLGFTAIYVTHDQEEAMALSDVVVLMNAGNIEQHGTPGDVFDAPATLFAATFLGCSNVLRGRVARREGRRVLVAITPEIQMWGELRGDSRLTSGDPAALAFRPSNVEISQSPRDVTFTATVRSAAFVGLFTDYELECAGTAIRAELAPEQRWPAGSGVHCFVPAEHVHVFADTAKPGNQD